jgi:hypothetical protein
MTTPSERDVEITIRGLEMQETEADVLRAFYARCRRQDAVLRNWRRVGRVIKYILMVLGGLVVLAGLAAWWLLPGGLP